jgi:hypothetical protein
MRKITKRAGVILGVSALGISGGVAWAVWSITGSATATATATTAQKITVTAHAEGLFPGGKKNLSITATNPNEFPVQITSWGTPSISTGDADCAGSHMVFVPPANPVILQPGTHSQTVVDGAQLSINAPDACQGETFTLNSENVTGISIAP